MKKEKFSMRLCAFATAALLLISGMAKLTPIPASAASSSEIRKQINALKEEKEEIKEKSPMFRCSIRKTRTKSRTLFPEKTSSTRNCSCFMTRWKTFPNFLSGKKILISFVHVVYYLLKMSKKRMRKPGTGLTHFCYSREMLYQKTLEKSNGNSNTNWDLAGEKTFPRGEGAPVRTLGRMRNGDIFQLLMQLVKVADYFCF